MVRFFKTEGAEDKAWLMLVVVACASKLFGKNKIFRYFGLPAVTGYMAIGFLCGPYVFRLMDKTQVQELDYVNHFALVFIALSAGAEMYIPEMKELIKPILWISFAMIVLFLLIGTFFIWSVAGTSILEWAGGYSPGCVVSISLLMATLLSARSPTSIVAVVRELQARGPVTSMLMGVTIGGDVIVLTFFAITIATANSFCSNRTFDAAVFLVELVIIPSNFILGYGLGKVITHLLQYRYLRHLVLPLGFLMYLIMDLILATSQNDGKYHITFDTLLICISAGFIAGNSNQREHLLHYLKSYAMYAFIPFFTSVGVKLNLPIFISAIGFSIVACVIRVLCMFFGCLFGGYMADQDSAIYMHLWMGLIPQAGVSLGLATIVAHLFEDTFGPEFESTVIGIILVNQIFGPFGVKCLLKLVKEDGKGDEKYERAFAPVDDPLLVLTHNVDCQTPAGVIPNALDCLDTDTCITPTPGLGLESPGYMPYHKDLELAGDQGVESKE